MKPLLSFSSGCVINLDDIQDFPDYVQTITKLTASIKSHNINWKAMGTFLDADIEDIQHIPQFAQLLKQLVEKHQIIFTKQHAEYKFKFMVLMMKLAKNYFTSFSMDDQQAQPILTILQSQLHHHQPEFCDFWLAISKFAPYVEKHEELIKLYLSVVDEKKIIQSQELSLMYLKSVDKVLRFRQFRQAFQKVSSLEAKGKGEGEVSSGKVRVTPLLDYKLALHFHKEDSQKIREYFVNLAKFVQILHKPSKFMKEYIEKKSLQLQ